MEELREKPKRPKITIKIDLANHTQTVDTHGDTFVMAKGKTAHWQPTAP